MSPAKAIPRSRHGFHCPVAVAARSPAVPKFSPLIEELNLKQCMIIEKNVQTLLSSSFVDGEGWLLQSACFSFFLHVFLFSFSGSERHIRLILYLAHSLSAQQQLQHLRPPASFSLVLLQLVVGLGSLSSSNSCSILILPFCGVLFVLSSVFLSRLSLDADWCFFCQLAAMSRWHFFFSV